MRYLLYPVRLIQHQDKLGKVNVFYESDDVFLDGNKLVAGGQVLFEGGSGVAYSPHSFLYLTP